MPSADDIQAMIDDVYDVAGIPCQWTPAGGAPFAFTAIELGGDEVGRLHGVVAEFNLQGRTLRARSAELAALAPGVAPRAGDAVAFLDGAGAVTLRFVVSGDPRQEDRRRLEWTLELADA